MKNLIEQNKKFFDKFSKYYDKGILGWWLNRILKKLLKEVSIKNNSVILDAGCGTGNFLYMLSESKTLKLGGIDISEKMLDIARGKLGNKTKLKLIESENLKYKNKFNYVFCAEAFHHFLNQKKSIENFYKALKKNGKLIIVDLDFGRILNFIFYKVEPGNSKMNSPSNFYRLFMGAGFKDIKQKRLGWFVVMTEGVK